MRDYILHIEDRNALYRYIAFLKECEFDGEIFLGAEIIDAKDILLLCDKLISKIFLRINRGNEAEIEEALRKNGFSVKVSI